MIWVLLACGFLVWLALAMCARRALPIFAGVAAAWTAADGGGGPGVAIMLGVAAIAGTAFVLDLMAEHHAWRPLIIVIECAAGVTLATTTAFALFDWNGVDGSRLAIAVIASGLIAATISLRHRLQA